MPTMFEDPNRIKIKKRSRWPLSLTAVVCLLLIIVAYLATGRVLSWGQKIYPQKSLAEIFTTAGQFVLAGDKPLAEEQGGELNILLMGVGGEGQGGEITPDTNIILSLKFDPATSTRVSLLSVPRDLAISFPGDERLHKINDVYKYAEWRSPGSGPQAEIAAMEDWTGIPIDYYAVLDTQGFKEAIDLVGGVDIVVDNPFFDPYYPDGKNGYLPKVTFEAGLQHLDGERALQFARSRHGNNGEASDFRRSRRQQKVLAGLKDKLSALNLIQNAGTVMNLVDTFANHFKTNLEPWQAKRLYDLISKVSIEQTRNNYLDPQTGFICSQIAPDTGWYLLVSCEGRSKNDVKAWAAKRFE